MPIPLELRAFCSEEWQEIWRWKPYVHQWDLGSFYLFILFYFIALHCIALHFFQSSDYVKSSISKISQNTMWQKMEIFILSNHLWKCFFFYSRNWGNCDILRTLCYHMEKWSLNKAFCCCCFLPAFMGTLIFIPVLCTFFLIKIAVISNSDKKK